MNFLIRFVANMLALTLVSHMVGGISIESWQALLVGSLVLGLLNTSLKPILIFFTLPFNILSLGIFTLFINAFIFYISSRLVPGFNIMSFSGAFWGAILFSIITFFVNLILGSGIQLRTMRYQHVPRRRKMHFDNVIDVESRTIGEEKDE